MKLILEKGVEGIMEVPQAETMDAWLFLKFCRQNPDMNMELDSHGNILIMAPVGFDGSKNELNASTALDNWSKASGLGYATNSNGGYRLPNGAVRVPDAAWVQRERIDELSKEQRVGFPPLCPDFVIEVRSATDSLKPLQQKMQEYMENGCRLAFLIDPIDKQAFIYRAGEAPEHAAGLDSKLSGGDILPGFELDLQLFA